MVMSEDNVLQGAASNDTHVTSGSEGAVRRARTPCTVDVDIHTHFCSSTTYPVKTTTGRSVVDSGEKKFCDFETLYVRIKAQYEMIPKLPEKKLTNEEIRNKAQRTNHIRRKLEEWLNELLCRNDVAADEALCSFLGIQPEDAVAGIGGFKDAPAKPWYVEHLEDTGVVPRTRNSLGAPRRSNSGNRLKSQQLGSQSAECGLPRRSNSGNRLNPLLGSNSTDVPPSPNALLSCRATPVAPRCNSNNSLGKPPSSSDSHGGDGNPLQWGARDRVSIGPLRSANICATSQGQLGGDDAMPGEEAVIGISRNSSSDFEPGHDGKIKQDAVGQMLRRHHSADSVELLLAELNHCDSNEVGLHRLRASKDIKADHKMSVVALARAMAIERMSERGDGDRGLNRSVSLGEKGFMAGEGGSNNAAARAGAGQRLSSRSSSVDAVNTPRRKSKPRGSESKSNSMPDGRVFEEEKKLRAKEKREWKEYMSKQAQSGRIETTGA